MVTEREIRKLQLENGRVPFDEWYHSLVDKRMRAAVDIRLARVRLGHSGNHKPVGDGVNELKIDLGPGLRVYYGEYKAEFVLLLGGGDKSTQQRDINNAIRLWKQWKQFKKDENKEL
jgi:putative addiction module killer protein